MNLKWLVGIFIFCAALAIVVYAEVTYPVEEDKLDDEINLINSQYLTYFEEYKTLELNKNKLNEHELKLKLFDKEIEVQNSLQRVNMLQLDKIKVKRCDDEQLSWIQGSIELLHKKVESLALEYIELEKEYLVTSDEQLSIMLKDIELEIYITQNSIELLEKELLLYV